MGFFYRYFEIYFLKVMFLRENNKINNIFKFYLLAWNRIKKILSTKHRKNFILKRYDTETFKEIGTIICRRQLKFLGNNEDGLESVHLTLAYWWRWGGGKKTVTHLCGLNAWLKKKKRSWKLLRAIRLFLLTVLKL